MSTPTLYVATYSPWTERARWALDHHGVAYKQVDHVILLGEPLLRLRLRKLRGPVSIPALVDGDLRLGDSVAIARHAETIGQGAPLFRAGAAGATLDEWVARATEVMECGRVRLLPRMLLSKQARKESTPPVFGPVAGLLDPVAVTATRFVQKKYARLGHEPAAALEKMRATLLAARARLAKAPYLVDDRLSFADISLAAALQTVLPVQHPALRIGPATRAAWTEPELAADFTDVLAWRDRMYATLRPRRAGQAAPAAAAAA